MFNIIRETHTSHKKVIIDKNKLERHQSQTAPWWLCRSALWPGVVLGPQRAECWCWLSAPAGPSRVVSDSVIITTSAVIRLGGHSGSLLAQQALEMETSPLL